MTRTRSPALGQRRLMLIVTLVVAAFVLFFPARQLIHQREEMIALQDRLAELRAENQRLDSDVKRLEDPGELEVLARERLGLVRPGERAYFVEPTDAPPSSAEAQLPHPSIWGRVWSWLGSIVRGKR